MASKMVIYQNNECILKESGRFSNKSSKWKTELKSGGLPRKTVDLMCMQIYSMYAWSYQQSFM